MQKFIHSSVMVVYKLRDDKIPCDTWINLDHVTTISRSEMDGIIATIHGLDGRFFIIDEDFLCDADALLANLVKRSDLSWQENR